MVISYANARRAAFVPPPAPHGCYSAYVNFVENETIVSLESNVKEMLIALGFRHKNKPVELRALGNTIDTRSRRATFRFAVRWAKTPSAALTDDMRTGMTAIRPTTQAYASDVDFIDIHLELASNSVSQPVSIAE